MMKRSEKAIAGLISLGLVLGLSACGRAPEEAEEFVSRQAFEYHFYPEETDYQFRIEAECASGTMEIRVTCGTEEQIYAVSPSEPCRETVSVESGAAEEAQFDIEIQPDTEGGVRVEVLTCP